MYNFFLRAGRQAAFRPNLKHVLQLRTPKFFGTTTSRDWEQECKNLCSNVEATNYRPPNEDWEPFYSELKDFIVDYNNHPRNPMKYTANLSNVTVVELHNHLQLVYVIMMRKQIQFYLHVKKTRY